MFKIKFKDTPFRAIALLYIGGCLLFAFLYSLPQSQLQPLSFIDAWFLSASAISVTGLSSINVTETLSVFGKIILLIEIQIGGVGIMVLLGVLLMMFKEKLSLSQQTLMSFDQNQKGLKSVKQLILFILCYTFMAELLGFIVFYPTFYTYYQDGSTAFFVSLFHSVTSFTNAGFDLFGGNLTDYASHSLFIYATAFLIFLGVLGFPTVFELLFSKGKKLSLFTKVNLTVHGILLGVGLLFFFIFEFSHSLEEMNLFEQINNALFLSVTSRNAGLSMINLEFLSPSSLFLMMMLMFIGGSASSCAGGIRVTTFAVLWAKMMSVIKGREDVILFKRGIHEEDVNKSYLVFFIYFGLFILSCMILSFIEQVEFEQLMFEVMSALTTTGLSIGITEHLSTFSKIWLSLLMIIGRIGVISMIYSLVKPKKTNTKYIKEHIIVG